MTDKEIKGTPRPAEIDTTELQEILADASTAFDVWRDTKQEVDDLSVRAVFYHGFLWGRHHLRGGNTLD
jgi:hypothetical protein